MRRWRQVADSENRFRSGGSLDQSESLGFPYLLSCSTTIIPMFISSNHLSKQSPPLDFSHSSPTESTRSHSHHLSRRIQQPSPLPMTFSRLNTENSPSPCSFLPLFSTFSSILHFTLLRVSITVLPQSRIYFPLSGASQHNIRTFSAALEPTSRPFLPSRERANLSGMRNVSGVPIPSSSLSNPSSVRLK